jgi:hypothetical protein
VGIHPPLRGTILRLFLLLALIAAAAPALAAPAQRMVIAPGCYSLAPGDHYDIPAYCLDQSFVPPASGAELSEAPAQFGNAAVLIEGGLPLSLQAALQQHLVAIEGLGDHTSLRLRNLGATPLQICIRAPTVVMGSGDNYTGDLPTLYPHIAQVLASAGASPPHPSQDEDREAHDRLQRRLWSEVHEAEAQMEAAQRRPGGSEAVIYPEAPTKLPAPTPDASCAQQTGGVTVCKGK